MFSKSDDSKFFSWLTRSAYLPDFQKYFPKYLHGFIFGATFGLAWTPCVGPILGGVLAYVASQDRSLVESALMMFTFGAGVVAPFIALAFGGEVVSSRLKALRKYLPKIEVATGYGLVVFGIFILTQSNLPSVFEEGKTPNDAQFVTASGEVMQLTDPSLKEHKLLFFHTDNCPVCHAMESYMPTVEKECESDTFQIVRVNVSRSENQAIADLFNVRAVPTLSMVSPEGEEIARTVGYQSEEKLRQGISIIPSTVCSSDTKPQGLENPYVIPQEGESCSPTSAGLTC